MTDKVVTLDNLSTFKDECDKVYTQCINNAGFHNSIFRGKDITAEWDNGTVSTNIADGTFKDIFVGDYFTKSATINGTVTTLTFIIADINTYYGYNSYAMIDTPHISVVVKGLPNARMNINTTTAGGYKGSEMHTITLPAYCEGIEAALGSEHILTHQKKLSNSVNTTAYNRFGSNSGCSNSWEWVSDMKISLMTESQIYGHIVWSSSGHDTGEAYKPLSLFQKVRPNQVFGESKWFWLRDVGYAGVFCCCNVVGTADCLMASSVGGVFPLLLLK